VSDKLEGVFKKGYGFIPKSIMKDDTLDIEAKGIYAYLASYTGGGTTAYPSVSLITSDLNISENRYYKYRKQLLEKGYISIKKNRKNGKRDNNIYVLNLHPQFQYLQNEGIENEGIEFEGTNNNSINNNSNNNNSKSSNSCSDSKTDPEPEELEPKFDEKSVPYKAALHLRNLIANNFPRQPLPDETPEDLEDWAIELERLNRLGPVGAKKHEGKGYTWQEIRDIMDWCQDDNFWKGNILSASKFREQIIKLEGKMKSNNAGDPDGMNQTRELYQEFLEEEEGTIDI